MKQAGKEAEESISVGMIVHGGTIMALLSQLYGGSYFDYQVPNGRGYFGRITVEDHKTVRMTELERV